MAIAIVFHALRRGSGLLDAIGRVALGVMYGLT